jgi:hypothetical protein
MGPGLRKKSRPNHVGGGASSPRFPSPIDSRADRVPAGLQFRLEGADGSTCCKAQTVTGFELTHWATILQAVVVVFALAIAVAAARFARRAARSSEDSVHVAQHALDATAELLAALNRNADATMQIAELTRQNLGKDRAWLCPVHVEYASFQGTLSYGQHIKDGAAVVVQWKNLGNVPAVRVGTLTWVESEAGDLLSSRDSFEKPLPRPGIVGPSGMQQTAMCILNDEVTTAFRSRKLRLIIKSKICYQSALGEREHVSTVTYAAEHQGEVPGPGGGAESILFSMVEASAA